MMNSGVRLHCEATRLLRCIDNSNFTTQIDSLQANDHTHTVGVSLRPFDHQTDHPSNLWMSYFSIGIATSMAGRALEPCRMHSISILPGLPTQKTR
jgi:hypothetical protein